MTTDKKSVRVGCIVPKLSDAQIINSILKKHASDVFGHLQVENGLDIGVILSDFLAFDCSHVFVIIEPEPGENIALTNSLLQYHLEVSGIDTAQVSIYFLYGGVEKWLFTDIMLQFMSPKQAVEAWIETEGTFEELVNTAKYDIVAQDDPQLRDFLEKLGTFSTGTA